MPKFKVDTSLFEPVEIDVGEGRVFKSVPFSPPLFREIDKLEAQKKAGTLEGFEYVLRYVALIFGLKPEDLDGVDVRILSEVMRLVDAAMNAGKPAAKAKDEPGEKPSAEVQASPEAAEATASKNEPKPGDESSQS